MTLSGKLYSYNANANAGNDTYRIVWVRYVGSSGYWTGTNGVDHTGVAGDGETKTGSNDITWHVDGYIVINDNSRFTVSYDVVDSDGNVLLNQIASELIMNGETAKVDVKIENGQIPKGYQEIPGKTNIWYTDRGCTNQYDSTTLVMDNITLYTPVQPVQQDGQPVYYYVMNPEKLPPNSSTVFTVESTQNVEDMYWFYMGNARANLENPEQLDKGYRFAYSAGPQVEPGNYPALTIDGKSYTYNPNANGGTDTYRIVWVRYVVSGGYWTGKDGATGAKGDDKDRFVNNEHQAWHVDGYIVFNDCQHVVTYQVVDVDTKEVIAIAGTQPVENGKNASGLEITIPEGYEIVEGKTNRWYRENGCTNEYIFSENPVTGDITIYTPVKKIPDTVNVRFVKTDGSDKPLAGASFKLYNKNPTDVNVTDAKVIVEGVSGENGIIFLDDLELEMDQNYYLVETGAPDGYIPMPGVENILIKGGGDGPVFTPIRLDWECNEDGTYVITVPNNPGTVLPSTGGPGTAQFIAFGIALMTTAAFVLVMQLLKRKGRARA